jgi:transcriptional regulator with XRE-family HTH domain
MPCVVRRFYRFGRNMPTCIRANRYGRLLFTVNDERPWVGAIYRLLAALRPDPRNPHRQKPWTQGELSEASGVNANTISAWLVHGTEPSIANLQKIADAFRVPLWTFFVSEHQADVLSKQERAQTILTNESEIAARVEQTVISKLALLVKDATADIMSGQLAAPPAKELPAPRPRLAATGSRKKR